MYIRVAKCTSLQSGHEPYLFHQAFPIEPNSSIFVLTVSLIASKPGARSLRGSNPLLILTSLDILAGCLCKCQLALSIYINLRYT